MVPLVFRIAYIKVVNGRNRIPRQGRIYEPPKTTLNKAGRAIHAKMRKNREKPATNPVKQPELFLLISLFPFLYENPAVFLIYTEGQRTVEI